MVARGYGIESFCPVKASIKTLKPVIDLLDELFLEVEQDDPIPDRDERMVNFRDQHPYLDLHWWLIKRKEQVVGFAFYRLYTEESPNYEQNKHISRIVIRLHSEHRKKELYLKVLATLIAELKNEKAVSVVQVGASNVVVSKFLESINGELAITSVENRCKIADINLDLMKEWRNIKDNLAEEGVILELYKEKIPEKLLEEFAELYNLLMNIQPLEGLENRPKITTRTVRLKEQRLLAKGNKYLVLLSREKDGTISGLTEIVYNPKKPFQLRQELTGVMPNYQGRGLGKLLKAEMLFIASEEFPDLRYIRTRNTTTNNAMISINKRMGFKEHSRREIFNFTLENLRKQLK